jgi:chromate transport protein ChrA
MITSVFGKSRPFNYILIISLFVIFYFLFVAMKMDGLYSGSGWLTGLGILVFLIASFFIANFIAKRNQLSRDNSFAFLFYCTHFLFFPNVFSRPELILSSFFILLSLRKIFSMQSMIHMKQKIFDASFWIVVASLFHFPAIFLMVLVFIAILLHAGSDYRNWMVPFIAFVTIAIIVAFLSLVFQPDWLYMIRQKMYLEINPVYPEEFIQQFVLGVYGVFAVIFLISLLMTLSKRPLILLNAFKKLIFVFVLGLAIILCSLNLIPEVVIYLFFPVALMASAHTEHSKGNFSNELISVFFLLFGVLAFFLQL